MADRRRIMKDTPEAAHQMVQSILSTVVPPLRLKDRELEYFNDIIASREGATWTRNDKIVACHLAKTYLRLEQIDAEINRQGFLLENARGTPVQNPALVTLTSLSNAVQTFCRILGLTASNAGTDGPGQKRRSLHEGQLREVLEGTGASQDELI